MFRFSKFAISKVLIPLIEFKVSTLFLDVASFGEKEFDIDVDAEPALGSEVGLALGLAVDAVILLATGAGFTFAEGAFVIFFGCLVDTDDKIPELPLGFGPVFLCCTYTQFKLFCLQREHWGRALSHFSFFSRHDRQAIFVLTVP